LESGNQGPAAEAEEVEELLPSMVVVVGIVGVGLVEENVVVAVDDVGGILAYDDLK
jgi:hypothetical protein